MDENKIQQLFNIDTEYVISIAGMMDAAKHFLSIGDMEKFFIQLDILCTYLAPKIEVNDSENLKTLVKNASRYKKYWKAKDAKVPTHEDIESALDGWKTLLFMKDERKIMSDAELNEGSNLFIVKSRDLHDEIIRLFGEYGIIHTGRKSRY